ncbi:lipocalin family protein [Tamlana fucoidanivorans]|uniref:Lipocalin-like domain-containing protein n=1 Tax=Allotamlana fucoidanivorans TaxID=2583814 RepID=A0A5C4SS25_9FLAO|nr:lipocalin family protein [Tamlana fucoidanivorans]TNJ46411.1 hypothetical protein FGF67_01950 [Tamlana fucoidanivorans]
MKKLIILSLILFVTFSCSKDSESENSKISASIIGVWQGTGMTYDGTVESSESGQTIKADFTGEGFNMNNTLTFNENPNTLVSKGSYGLKLTYTINGFTTTEEINETNFIEDGTWSLEGDQLFVTNNGETTIMKILELSNHKLIISFSETEVIEEEGVIATTNFKGTFVFKR